MQRPLLTPGLDAAGAGVFYFFPFRTGRGQAGGGCRPGFRASSDPVSTHLSYRALWVPSPAREGLLEAFKKRRLRGAAGNILAAVRRGGQAGGELFWVIPAWISHP